MLDTLDDIVQNRLRVEDLPTITVIANNGHFFSLNNRRLYVLKALRSRGLLEGNVVTVRMKEALPRELERYTVDRCSLSASLMCARSSDEPSPDDQDGRAEVEPIDAIEAGTVDANEIMKICKSGDDSTGVSLVGKVSSTKADKLAPTILSSVNSLTTLVEKGKSKQAMKKIDEWAASGLLLPAQRSQLLDLVGLS